MRLLTTLHRHQQRAGALPKHWLNTPMVEGEQVALREQPMTTCTCGMGTAFAQSDNLHVGGCPLAEPTVRHDDLPSHEGLEHRFDVWRLRWRDRVLPGGAVKTERTRERVTDCFVLRIDRDPHARIALLAYADACEEAIPSLAADLREWVATVREGEPRAVLDPLDPLVRALTRQPDWFEYDTIRCSVCGGERHYEDSPPHPEDPPFVLCAGFEHTTGCPVPGIEKYVGRGGPEEYAP